MTTVIRETLHMRLKLKMCKSRLPTTLSSFHSTLIYIIIASITLISSQGLAQEQKTITVARLDAPISQYRIMSIQVLEAAYSKLGYKINILNASGRGAINWANSGFTDALFARIVGLEKQFTNLVRIKVPIAYDTISAYSKDRSLNIRKWADLKSLRIAYIRGFKKAEQNTEGMEVTETDTTEKSFELLKKGRVDVVIALTSIQEQVRHDSNCEIVATTPHIDVIKMYHYLNSAHQNLADKLNNTLQEMDQSGELFSIQQMAIKSLHDHNKLFSSYENCQ